MIKNEESFFSHVKELKYRLILCIAWFAVFFALSLYFAQHIFAMIAFILPAQNKTLIFTSFTEVFFVYIKISCLTALFISLPFFLYHLYRFLAPGLYKNEKSILISYMIFAPLLFVSGIGFVYSLVSAQVMGFFSSFAGNFGDFEIKLMPKISEFYDLIVTLFLAFGLSFQLPIVLTLLVRFGIMTVEQLRKARRIAIVVIFCFAAIITPPDAISQIILAIPLILLYEIAIMLCNLIKKPGDKKICTI